MLVHCWFPWKHSVTPRSLPFVKRFQEKKIFSRPVPCASFLFFCFFPSSSFFVVSFYCPSMHLGNCISPSNQHTIEQRVGPRVVPAVDPTHGATRLGLQPCRCHWPLPRSLPERRSTYQGRIARVERGGSVQFLQPLTLISGSDCTTSCATIRHRS